MILDAAAVARGSRAVIASNAGACVCRMKRQQKRPRPRRDLQFRQMPPFLPIRDMHTTILKTPEMPDQVSVSSRSSLIVKKGCSSVRTGDVECR